jgi:hypothetical protein
MKNRATQIAVVVLGLMVVVNGVLAVTASPPALEMNRYVIGGGGGHSEVGNHTLEGTVGQGVVGTVSNSPYKLCAGFWCGIYYLPDIDVQGQGHSIADGDGSPSPSDGTDFGSLGIGSPPTSHTFTISNSGYSDLILTGSPAVTLSSGTHFSVTVQPNTPIVSHSVTNFVITFAPSAIGYLTDTIHIANNDQDENPYTFSIAGKGTNLAFFLPIILTHSGP